MAGCAATQSIGSLLTHAPFFPCFGQEPIVPHSLYHDVSAFVPFQILYPKAKPFLTLAPHFSFEMCIVSGVFLDARLVIDTLTFGLPFLHAQPINHSMKRRLSVPTND